MNQLKKYILHTAGLAIAAIPLAGALGQEGEKPDFPPFAEVSKGYEKVVSTADGAQSLYSIWRRDKDGQLLAELPRGFDNQRHLIAATLAAGDTWAGLHSGIFTADADRYFYWKRFDKRLAMIAPQIDTRSTGDQQSKDSVERQFTDRVLLDVPIVCMGPSGQPVIDLDELLAARATEFFGGDAAGGNARLATVAKCKAFPQNIEVAIEMPTRGGVLRTFHYSVRNVPDNTGYKPREADERVGYFTTTYRDLGKFRDDQKWVRFINRWNIEKADPSLKLSPPKRPLVYYIEDTVPVRYRRFVRDGILCWNKAFEKVGIKDAIEVYYQDKATGQNMDKDPEDARYNFIRWLSNDQGTAVGPSRVHPLTGEILDADIVLTDGWIRHFWYQSNEYLPETATQGLTPETLNWLMAHPQWDPRVRMASPTDRDRILAERSGQGVLRFGGRVAGDGDTDCSRPMSQMLSYQPDDTNGVYDPSDESRLCLASNGKALDMALMGMNLEIMGLLDEDPQPVLDPKKPEKKDEKKGDTLDGIPEWFIGPMLADLVAHELGHTLGLRHNFKASTVYSLNQINSDEVKGKPFTGSVMDYIPVNINMQDGKLQGDFCMTDIGPYDFWAIEYGYTFGDPKEVLKRVAEPELVYGTDEDTIGPDPRAKRYDFSANPLDFANSRMKLVAYHRERILNKFVKEGQSFSRARRGYSITLNDQTSMVSMMSGWVGASYVNRDRKGDPNARTPVTPVPAAQQRAALEFVVNNAFKDEAFGLTPELLQYMTVDKWSDAGGMRDLMSDPTWEVHDRIIGIQASALTMIMNPTTLKRVYDNEFRIPADQDALTLPEVMDTMTTAIWSEFKNGDSSGSYTPRKPKVSSLRRNLQREYVDRLIDLSLPNAVPGAAGKPISNLAIAQLKTIKGYASANGAGYDAYTKSHLAELATRIDKALDAQYIYNNNSAGGGGQFGGFFGQPTGK
ncbi:MAG: zinc-dependent metalloprotease [Phycisphaerales bacterium]